MRVLIVLTYYAPHISGVTVYARRLVRRLVAGGVQVTVLTSHYSHTLPKSEEMDGATIVRSPVLLRISKGVLMPLFLWQASRLIPSHDLVHLHLPQFEASLVAVLAKLQRRPIVVSYHCDMLLPSRGARLLFGAPINGSHLLACALADKVVANSEDYAASSPLLKRFGGKLLSVYPPIELDDSEANGAILRRRYNLGSGPLVGFVGRFAFEKGICYLIESVPHILREVPEARLVMAGLTESAPGEDVHVRLRPKMEALGFAPGSRRALRRCRASGLLSDG